MNHRGAHPNRERARDEMFSTLLLTAVTYSARLVLERPSQDKSQVYFFKYTTPTKTNWHVKSGGTTRSRHRFTPYVTVSPVNQ